MLYRRKNVTLYLPGGDFKIEQDTDKSDETVVDNCGWLFILPFRNFDHIHIIRLCTDDRTNQQIVLLIIDRPLLVQSFRLL